MDKDGVQQPDMLLRITQVLDLIPISKSAWWMGVRDGRFPKPLKLGPRITCWRLSDVLTLIESTGTEVRKGKEGSKGLKS